MDSAETKSSEGRSRKKRSDALPDAERKLRKQIRNKERNERIIFIGVEFERFRKLKEDTGIQTDQEVVKILLDTHNDTHATAVSNCNQVHLGEYLREWTTMREELCLSDKDLAKMLIKCFKAVKDCKECSTIVFESQEVEKEPGEIENMNLHHLPNDPGLSRNIGWGQDQSRQKSGFNGGVVFPGSLGSIQDSRPDVNIHGGVVFPGSISPVADKFQPKVSIQDGGVVFPGDVSPIVDTSQPKITIHDGVVFPNTTQNQNEVNTPGERVFPKKASLLENIAASCMEKAKSGQNLNNKSVDGSQSENVQTEEPSSSGTAWSLSHNATLISVSSDSTGSRASSRKRRKIKLEDYETFSDNVSSDSKEFHDYSDIESDKEKLKGDPNYHSGQNASTSGYDKPMRQRKMVSLLHTDNLKFRIRVKEKGGSVSAEAKKKPSDYKSNFFILNDGKNSNIHIKYKPYIEPVFGGHSQADDKMGNIGGENSDNTEMNKDGENPGERPVKYKCKSCGIVLSTLLWMQRHVLHKEIVESVPCQYCGRKFSSLGKKTHEFHYRKYGFCKTRKRRILLCTYENCSYNTNLKTSLDEHIGSVHLNSRGHACTWEGCEKRFNTISALRVHTLTHTDEKPIVCYLCGYRCRQKASLNWHMKSKHPEQSNF